MGSPDTSAAAGHGRRRGNPGRGPALRRQGGRSRTDRRRPSSLPQFESVHCGCSISKQEHVTKVSFRIGRRVPQFG